MGKLPAGVADDGFAVVVDIGKTLSKVSLWTRDGRLLDRQSRLNSPRTDNNYRALDIDGIGGWLLDSLTRYAGQPVESIIAVAHGAAFVALADGALAFPPPDYEHPVPDLAGYRAGRDGFDISGSPALPGGLNLGAQLHWMEALHGELFRRATLLPFAQYWAWFLSGEARSEATSLGCHSDLWAHGEGHWSPLAVRRGWSAQFAPLARAGDALGRLRPEIVAATGLPASVRVHCGLHDSNAALHAACGFDELGQREATVLSTGTWFVAMRTPGGRAAHRVLDASRDCLVNVDILGRPLPSARFMGGREIELLGARIDRPGTEGVAEVLRHGTLILPGFVHGSGPFPSAHGRWLREAETAAERDAAVAIYAALMADVSLDLIGSGERLLVEGRFAGSEIFVRALAALRPDTQVFVSSEGIDASFGALRAIVPDVKPAGTLQRVPPLSADICRLRDEWRATALEPA